LNQVALEEGATMPTSVREPIPPTTTRPPDGSETLEAWRVKKSKSYIFPSEFLAVLPCERVPIRWRLLFTVAVYPYARAAELEALECEDIDLEHRLIHIHRAIDRSKDGKVKSTKTNNPRRIPIEPALMPLLVTLKREATGRRLLSMPPECDLSPRLRQYLE
jgi:integrase